MTAPGADPDADTAQDVVPSVPEALLARSTASLRNVMKEYDVEFDRPLGTKSRTDEATGVSVAGAWNVAGFVQMLMDQVATASRVRSSWTGMDVPTIVAMQPCLHMSMASLRVRDFPCRPAPSRTSSLTTPRYVCVPVLAALGRVQRPSRFPCQTA